LSLDNIVTGDTDAGKVEKIDEAEVLKLHGSVDWIRTDPRSSPPRGYGWTTDLRVKREAAPEKAIASGGLVLGTPGPSKHRVVTTELSPLWAQATKRLESADAIVFVGYRFPPSDAHAREHLLKAIMDNSKGQLPVHIVLGPQKDDKDQVRLREMLHAVLTASGRSEAPAAKRWFIVRSHGMWAEDFMSVFERERLIGWVAGAQLP
jgi:hypothetical protein